MSSLEELVPMRSLRRRRSTRWANDDGECEDDEDEDEDYC